MAVSWRRGLDGRLSDASAVSRAGANASGQTGGERGGGDILKRGWRDWGDQLRAGVHRHAGAGGGYRDGIAGDAGDGGGDAAGVWVV